MIAYRSRDSQNRDRDARRPHRQPRSRGRDRKKDGSMSYTHLIKKQDGRRMKRGHV